MKHLLIIICLLNGVSYGLQADINNDGRVDVGDLAILAREWLMQEVVLDVSGVGFTPDIAGTYREAGFYNGEMSYQRDGFYIWYNRYTEQWVISTGKGVMTGKIWIRNNEYVTGCYMPFNGVVGVPIVSEAI